jgi:hypothetical protein
VAREAQDQAATMKRFVGTLAAGALLGVAANSNAQGVDEFGRYGPRGSSAESPQNFALEVRIGRYLPSVDDEFDGHATPYQTMFGNDNRYSIGLEFDWQALRIPYFGTLGPGFSFGYTKSTAAGFKTSTVGLGTPPEPAGEDTSLKIFPMYAVAVLRADVLARETPVPLVPYAKLGFGAAIWSVGNGGGTASVPGITGSGLSYGPQFALGGMLLLDSFDRTAAKGMDGTVGVNNSYFFLEWYVSALGLTGNQMRVGTNTWVLGLALEF